MIAVMNPGQLFPSTGAQEMELNGKFYSTKFANFSARMLHADPVKILEYANMTARGKCQTLMVVCRDVPDSGSGRIVHSQRYEAGMPFYLRPVDTNLDSNRQWKQPCATNPIDGSERKIDDDGTENREVWHIQDPPNTDLRIVQVPMNSWPTNDAIQERWTLTTMISGNLLYGIVIHATRATPVTLVILVVVIWSPLVLSLVAVSQSALGIPQNPVILPNMPSLPWGNLDILRDNPHTTDPRENPGLSMAAIRRLLYQPLAEPRRQQATDSPDILPPGRHLPCRSRYRPLMTEGQGTL
jgi:hypothetical protein